MPALGPSRRVALDRGRIVEHLASLGATWTDVRVLAETGSTNADLAALAAQSVPEGVAVTTDLQTAGRGRLARSWSAPWASSTATSVLVRPRVPARDWGWLPLLAGVAVARSLGHSEVGLKWPNDIVTRDGAKLGGILSERLDAGAVVIGIGVNVDQGSAELVGPGATSLRLLGDGPPPREELIARQITFLEQAYDQWQADGGSGVLDAYRLLCTTLGKVVEIRLPDGARVIGEATDIDGTGRLVVESTEGTASFSAGDVVHLRSPDA